MTLKKFALLLLTLILSTQIKSAALAQNPGGNSPVKSTQNWQCLSPGQTNNDKTRTPLTGNCLPAGEESYLVCCADTTEGTKCTTGEQSYDDILGFGQNNVATLSRDFTCGFVGGAKIKPTDGRVNTTAITQTTTGERTGQFITRTFAFHCVTQGETEVSNEGQGNTLQYGTSEFEDNAACLSVRLDPYGTVFDSQSLEPLPSVAVTILDTNKTKLSLPGVPNPITTFVDGAFNFLVESGTYYLTPAVPGGYGFEAQPFLHPNYVRAYSNIYKPDEAIIENPGIPEHRDIALNPGVNTPHRANPTNMNYGTSQLGDIFKITGKQSHPLTVVSFRQTDKEIATTAADRFGFYEVTLKNTLVSPFDLIDVYLTKVDLTASEQTAVPRKAITIELHPPYIEGKATDKKGNVIANARVRVKLKMSDKVYHEAEADANGVFIVSPQNVPINSFYLEITPPNSLQSIKLTTTEFAKINKEYLAANNIDLMAATKNGRPLIEKRKAANPTPSSETVITPPASTQPANNNTLVTLIVLLGVMITIAGLYFFLKHRQKLPDESTPPMPPNV